MFFPAYAKGGRDGDGRGAGDDKTIQRRPWDSDTADRKDRLPSQGVSADVPSCFI